MAKMLRLETGALEMGWTKTPPIEDGLYWLKMGGDNPTVVNVYDCHEKDKYFGPMVSLIGTDWDRSVHELTSKYACEWFGPIAPPEHP